jgi:hypothetical protein
VMNRIIPTTKTSRHLADHLASLTAKAGNLLFARDDQTARGHGWKVISRYGGLARRYRDPRFDTLRACPECEGGGYAGGEPCGACQGTGRVTRELPRPGEVAAGDDNALAATA